MYGLMLEEWRARIREQSEFTTGLFRDRTPVQIFMLRVILPPTNAGDDRQGWKGNNF